MVWLEGIGREQRGEEWKDSLYILLLNEAFRPKVPHFLREGEERGGKMRGKIPLLPSNQTPEFFEVLSLRPSFLIRGSRKCQCSLMPYYRQLSEVLFSIEFIIYFLVF
ncbi:hypothetical protein L6164_016637 [Bauhinia variegata]|uniref:Uncharacterized protein n=1 Tax=Bauhinia variegata TaxID=167791 RepID=A0ACB9NQ52_BAUVA|nr:hypothetical protein L6164_016637 [Bauhinia variegata]